MNKDFLKQIFANEKKLLKLSELKTVNVPKYDELGVKNVFKKLKEDKEFMQYLPDSFSKGREPDRTYVFNVLNTIRPEYVSNLIKHASAQRNTCTEQSNHAQEIFISPEWQ